MNDEVETATILELVLAGKPARVAEGMLAGESREVRGAVAAMTNAVATLAASVEPMPAPAALRARLLESVARAAAVRPRAALLVVDMLNDHLTPGRPLEVPRARLIVPALAARIDAARRSGMPVVYVMDEHEPDDPDLDIWTVHNVKGTQGAEVWPALTPKPGDRIVHKPTYSAFTRSSLEDVLDELQVETLILTGCVTELGIMATATDAMERGFAVEIPSDSQAGASEAAEQAILGIVRVMAPYGAARKARVERLTAHA